MSLALTGLIVLQSLWIRNAYIVKENNFDQLVQKALAEATYSIQRNETMSFIYDEINQGNYDTTFLSPVQNFNFDTVIQFEIDTGDGRYFSQDFKISHNTEDGQVRTNISVTANAGLRTDPEIQDENKIFDKISNRRNFIDQVVSRMFTFTPEIEQRITAAHIRKYVGRALHNQGIKTDFEFAVTKWNDQVVFTSDGFQKDQLKEYYRVKLFPDDFFDSSNHLTIYFPNRRNFIISSLGFMGISSSILTLFLLVTFSFILYVILKQKQLSEMKSDFVNNMTHELKTPISTISLASQMLSDNSLSPDKKNYERISGIIHDETKRLGYQVERVLQMAKFDQDDLTLQFKDVSVHDVIEAVIANFVLQIESRNGMLIPSLHADNDIILADTVHISNIISNLLDNAVKYTAGTPEIFIETRNVQDFILIAVRDNGIGISKANQRRVFDKFFRVSTGNVHNVKGFGLGLSYVRKIVLEHHGTVTLESEPGVGTTFFVKLPLKK